MNAAAVGSGEARPQNARETRYPRTRVATAVRLPESLLDRLRQTADDRDTSVQHLLIRAAGWYLDSRVEASLFKLGDFTMHSGGVGHWKIECDALSDDDIECLAFMLSERLGAFSMVHGIPRGGLRLAEAMEKYRTPGALGDLIVDDVLTTGAGMNEKWRELKDDSYGIQGAVVFARGPCPRWVTPLFTLTEAS